jgi:ATP-dependent Lhr-like helicase
VHADSFHAVRSLFDARDRGSGPTRVGRGLRRGTSARHGGEGRWTVFAEHLLDTEPDELAEAVAEQLLARWGVVFHGLVARESLALPWREILWALRRLEARGLIRGGRFVTGFSGEQYALPQVVDHLARVRRTDRSGIEVTINACDPLNLTGVITPGERVTARRSLSVRYMDGVPIR